MGGKLAKNGVVLCKVFGSLLRPYLHKLLRISWSSFCLVVFVFMVQHAEATDGNRAFHPAIID